MPETRQGGAGALSLLTTLVAFVLAVMFSIKVVPYYLDDYAIAKVLSSLDKKPGIENAALEQTQVWLEKGFQSNRIELRDDELRIRGRGDQLSVDISYERRVHLLYNMDLILTFEHDWKVKPK